MEFKDNAVDDRFSDLRERQYQLEDELEDIKEQIETLIADNEQA